MPDATGFVGAWLERMGSYSDNALTRITKARAEINADTYDSKKFFKHVLEAYDDTMDLWTAPWVFGASAPDALIVFKKANSQAALQKPILVQPPNEGEPEATDLVLLGDPTKKIGMDKIKPTWKNDVRGRLSIGLVGMATPVPKGYYLGAIHIDQNLLAALHVKVID